MLIPWTPEQVWGLAPDIYSLRISRSFAQPERWQSFGCGQQMAWGEFPIKDKPPYRSSINLSALAFACSCQSRKFPCSHSLSLLLLLIEQPDLFAEISPPAWVARSLLRKKPAQQDILVPEARANLTQQRLKNIQTGLRELDLWLCDLVRGGLAVAQSRPTRYWTQMADRLVDAQLGEIAAEFQQLTKLSPKQSDSPEKLLRSLSKMHLLIQGFQNYDTLPPTVQADLRAAVGWLPRAEANDRSLVVSDCWHVVGRQVEQVGKQLKQRVWLWGKRTNKPAWLVDLAHRPTQLDVSLVVGTMIEAKVDFYPSAFPLRAQIKPELPVKPSRHRPDGYVSICAAMSGYTAAMTANPWLRHFPMLLNAVSAEQDEGRWRLHDPEGYILPLPEKFGQGWHLHALSRGDDLPIFGEWDGEMFQPLSIWQDDRLLELHILGGVA